MPDFYNNRQPIPLPDDEQAKAFMIMLSSGLPSEQAILYFTDSEDPGYVALLHAKWLRSRTVQKAQKDLLGKSWQEMTLDEKIDTALAQHYAAQAYLLLSVNYVTANPTEKSKLDSARQSLEAKKAGTAGQMTALDRFFADVKSGSIKLPGKPAN